MSKFKQQMMPLKKNELIFSSAFSFCEGYCGSRERGRNRKECELRGWECSRKWLAELVECREYKRRSCVQCVEAWGLYILEFAAIVLRTCLQKGFFFNGYDRILECCIVCVHECDMHHLTHNVCNCSERFMFTDLRE